MSVIYLYAEVLANIRQVTLYASLETVKNEETKLDISSDKKIITVHHNGESASIYLPTEISGTAQITIPTERRKEISVRLEIGDVSNLRASDPGTHDVEVPWSAKDMTTDAILSCKACCAPILLSGKIGKWKDMPSENWAEMMEFWHCHRPHGDHQAIDDHAANGKGYAANSKVTASEGVGLIDTVSFLVDETDCTGLKFVSCGIEECSNIIQCTTCQSPIGQDTPALKGYQLFKSRLLVQPRNEAGYESYEAATFITAQLLGLTESQVTRKFVLHSGIGRGKDHGLLLWVFNPDIHYSSSRLGPTSHRAMKVFHQLTTRPFELLGENDTSYEELFVPSSILDEFEKTLTENRMILPESARNFQEWQVGLLNRYESHPISGMDQQPLAQKALPLETPDAEKIDGLLKAAAISAWPESFGHTAGTKGLLE